MTIAIAAMAAFNLVCSGVMLDSDPLKDKIDSQQITLIYRIDLGSRRWCKEDCSRIMPIHSVSDRQIFLNFYHSSSVTWIVRMNRQTGKFQDVTRWVRTNKTVSMLGKCQRAPFTGFP